MFLTSVWKSVILLLGIYEFCTCEEIGTVHIGALGNASGLSNTTTYSFNLNAGMQQLPIYITITNTSNPSQVVPLRDNVDISCEASNTRPGYSSVTFGTLDFAPASPSFSTVSLNLVSSGREVDIRCFGISRGFTCPVNTSSSAQQPQFCRDTSISSPVTLSVRPAPIVSFCSPVIIVPDDSSTSATFSLTFSEAVQVNPLDVFCVVTSAIGLDLTVPGLVIAGVNSNSVTVTYQVNTRGESAEVSCRANSKNGGTQYLNATSTGVSSQATFVLSTGQVLLLPSLTNGYSNTFKALLALDTPMETDNGIGFACRALVMADIGSALQEVASPSCDFTATTTPAATSASTPATTADVNSTEPLVTPGPVDFSSPWVLQDDDKAFTFQQGQAYKILVASRQLPVLEAVSEIVVVTCCVSETVYPKYRNQSTAMLSSNHVKPNFCANCTGGPESGDVTAERVIQNPSFVEVGPCPCDLTFQLCDINCCCDLECSTADKQTFRNCIPGPYGGQAIPTPFRNCNSNHPFKDDWFPLMCVVFETNAFLGLFYGNTPALRTEASFNSRLNAQTLAYSYREREQRFRSVTSTQYKDGDLIRTYLESGKQGILILPDRTSGSGCLNTAPIRYLRDRGGTCVRNNIIDLCREDSILSASVYVESSRASHPPCPKVYSLLDASGETNISNIYVNYYCAADDTNYVTSFERYSRPNSPSTFPVELYLENCTAACSEPACLLYNENQGTPTAQPLPPRCSWDDGYTRPGQPSPNGNVCDNVVVDVRYTFTWTGQQIVRLNADIVLAPVRINSQSPSLTQNFDVKFQHLQALPNSAEDDYDNTNSSFSRSGKPGYEFARALLSGCPVYDNTTSAFQTVDRRASRQMAVFRAGNDGLCYNAGRQLLTFGDDLSSSCMLWLDMDKLNNCTALRQIMLNHLSVLMPAELIGRQGMNDPTNQTMWVTVLRDIPDLNITADDNTTLGENSTLSDNETEVYQPLENVLGRCLQVPNGVSLTVLYAETGQTNGYTVREVVGARVSYSRSDWEMSCAGANAPRCYNNSDTSVQSFLLTSSVNYIKVPALSSDQTIRYFASRNRSCTTDACFRYFQDFDQSECFYDICLSQLLYPVSKAFGADPPMYTLTCSLVLVVFLIGYFIISRPWF